MKNRREEFEEICRRPCLRKITQRQKRNLLAKHCRWHLRGANDADTNLNTMYAAELCLSPELAEAYIRTIKLYFLRTVGMVDEWNVATASVAVRFECFLLAIGAVRP